MKKLLILLFGIAVSAACFAWSLQGTNPAQLRAAVQSADYRTLPLLMLFLFAFYWLKAMRWTWMLAPVRPLTTQQLFPPVMIGFAANNLLPAHLGEFVRVFLVSRRHDIPATTVLSTVVLERVFDVMAILGLFAISLQFADGLDERYRQAAIVLGGLSAVFVACATAFLIWTDGCIRLFDWGLRMVRVIPEGLRTKLVGMVRAAGDGLHSLRSVKTILLIVVNSLAQWVLNGLIAWAALRAFQVDVSPTDGLIITAITAIAVMVPSTPGYFGVIQGAFKVSLVAMGIGADPSRVFAASMYYHMCMYIPVTALGLLFLLRQGMSLKDLTRAAATKTEQEPSVIPSDTYLGTPARDEDVRL